MGGIWTGLTRVFWFALLLCHCNTVFGQVISGIVTDASTGAKLPYVHIGVKNTSKGTISKEDGSFQLHVEGVAPKARLFVSCLRYKEFSIPIDQLQQGSLDLCLEPAAMPLPEVIVRNPRKKLKQIKIGNFKNSSTTTGKSGNEPFGWGGEWGIILPRQKRDYQIKEVKFHLRFNTVDSVLFRINIYRIAEDGLPSQSVLLKPAFVTSKTDQHWIALNLKERNIWIEDRILVTMEWVRIWYAEDGQNLLFFSQAKNKDHRVLHRENSYGKWYVDEKPPLAIYVNGLMEN